MAYNNIPNIERRPLLEDIENYSTTFSLFDEDEIENEMYVKYNYNYYHNVIIT